MVRAWPKPDTLLANAAVHQGLVDVWRKATAWLVGRYLLMPDHLHLFCAPRDLEIPLINWVTYWKRQFSRLRLPGTGNWQRLFWDTRLRREENYDQKWDYIRQNPVKAGLVTHADLWPFQGELHVLPW